VLVSVSVLPENSSGYAGAEGEAILSEHAIIDFECGVAMRRVLVSEMDLTQLWWSL